MKKTLTIAVAILALAVVALLLLPPLIDLGNYKARYLPLLEDALQRKVDVGEVRLRILPSPSIRLSDLRILDNPAFSHEPFFAAQQTSLRLKLRPLLRGHFEVDEFILEDGEVTLQTKGEKPLRIQGIALSIKDFSTGQSFPYRVALAVPGVKAIVLEGLASYQESEATLRLEENHLKVQELDFTVNGSISSLTAAPQVNLAVSSETFETKSFFKLLAETGVMPRGLEISGPLELRLAARGHYNNLTSSVSADLKGLHVNDPRAFKGTVLGKIQVSLPLSGKAPVPQLLQGTGKLTAREGVLANLDLVSKIQVLTGLIGMPQDQSRGATTFKTLEGEFTLGNGVAEFTRLLLISPLVEARGIGKMTLTSLSLELSVEAALSPEISARAGSGRGSAFFKDEQGRIVIPLRVTGPANRPSVDLDKEKLVRKGLGQFLERGQGELLERFFRKR